MKFYFCETCGKRVTEKDVEAGQARNKKLNGVFCAQCAAGVMTMEMMPVTEDEARKILGKSPTPASGTPLSPGGATGKPKRETTGVQMLTVRKSSDAHITARPHSSPPPQARSKSNNVLVGVFAGLGVALLLGAVLLSSGGEKTKPAAENTSVGASSPLGKTPAPVAGKSIAPVAPVEPRNPVAEKTEAPSPSKEPPPTEVSQAPALPTPAPVPVHTETKGQPLALLKLNDFKGGGVCPNFWSQGKDGRAIWGKLSTRPSMTATFKLDAPPAGEGILRVMSLRHNRKEACKFAIELNGKTIFEGEAAATTWVWLKHDYKIPAGLLAAGENKLTFLNREDTNVENSTPWYMIHEVEVLAAGSDSAQAAVVEVSPLATIKVADLRDGLLCENYLTLGKDGHAIYGTLSPKPTAQAAFKLDTAPQGACVLRVTSIRHRRPEACKIAIEINKTVVFEGDDPATNIEVWEDHDFKIPDGVLVAGENKLVFSNKEPTSMYMNVPYYMIHEVKVLPAAAPVQTANASLKQLAYIKTEDLQDGQFYENYRSLGKNGCAIYGVKSPKPSMQALFKLDAAPQAACILRITGFRHSRITSCKIAIELNKTVVFDGEDPATNRDSWEVCDYKIPERLLVAGENKLVFLNREPVDWFKAVPYYMVHEVKILSAAGTEAQAGIEKPASPLQPAQAAASAPILTDEQRTILRFYNDTFAKLRNQQADAALTAAKNTKLGEAKPLAALLERADVLNKKALEALNKKPPTAPIKFKFKGDEMTGQLKRIEGPFAWVVAKGLEVRVGIEELPEDIFLEALSLDPATPEGQYDLVAFLFASGRGEAAATQAKRMDPAKNGDLLDMLEHYRLLQQLAQFETVILASEDAVKEAKTQEALRLIGLLKKNFPELASGDQKDRIAQLEARAEGTKLANRIKELFSGEVLAMRDDLYIEIKYDFSKAGTSREDFKGPQWTLTPTGLSYNQRYGADSELHFKAALQPKPMRAEFVQTAVDHDYCAAYLGKVCTNVRWIGGGQVFTTFTDKAPDVFNGKGWKHPVENGTYRYIFERTDKEAFFKLDQTEHYRDKLPAQAAEEKTCEIKLLPSRSIVIKEIVIKGFLDKDWIQDALKNLPQGPAGYRPGLWAAFHSGDANDRAKTYHFSRMEPKLSGDFGLGAPDKSMPIDNFTELLEGYIKIDADGEYQFELWADDFMSLKIGETLIAESSSGAIKRTKQEKGKLTLAKGYYPVKARFVEISNVAKFFTKWKPPGAASVEEIPASVFWHDAKQEEKK